MLCSLCRTEISNAYSWKYFNKRTRKTISNICAHCLSELEMIDDVLQKADNAIKESNKILREYP